MNLVKTVLVIFSLIFLSISAVLVVKSIKFDQNCGGYLKRAADANTVDLAKSQLKVALDYMEENELTSGYTSIVYRTPDEDISFWYNNIKNSYNELNTVSDTASNLLKSNVLMKLRETLLDKGSDSELLIVSIVVIVITGFYVYAENN